MPENVPLMILQPVLLEGDIFQVGIKAVWYPKSCLQKPFQSCSEFRDLSLDNWGSKTVSAALHLVPYITLGSG